MKVERLDENTLLMGPEAPSDQARLDWLIENCVHGKYMLFNYKNEGVRKYAIHYRGRQFGRYADFRLAIDAAMEGMK